MNNIGNKLWPARGRRGSVLILVVAVLAVLALLSLTLGYIAKVDLLAARNWGESVQSRMAVVSQLKFALAPSAATVAQAANKAQVTSGTSQRQALGLAPLVIGLTPDAVKLATDQTLAPSSTQTGFQIVKAGATKTVASATNTVADAPVEPTLTGAAVITDALANNYYEDESAKLNINAVAPDQTATAESGASMQDAAASTARLTIPGAMTEDALARFIATTLEAKKVMGVNARQLAHAIALRRAGAAGQTGASPTVTITNFQQNSAIKSAVAASGMANNVAYLAAPVTGQNTQNGTGLAASSLTADASGSTVDPRITPTGDGQPYVMLAELMNVPGMTLPVYNALAPYLTTLSVSFDAFALPAKSTANQAPVGFPQVDPNTAPAGELYQVLRQRFPNAPDAQLGQFVANIIDRRGSGDTPTAVRVGNQVFYGLKVNPCINEICPDVSSDDSQGDNGQYIELYNPYSQKTFSLAGWTVRIKDHAALQLTGTLPPGGYLVLTDDFNGENDQTHAVEAGTGSFYEIFHVVANPPKYQIKEFPALDLPDDAGLVQLVNPEGKVVDEFEYKDGRWNGSNTSLQRKDPRLRYYEKAQATPMAGNPGQTLSAEAQLALSLQEAWQNKPFRSPLDVMLVSTAYVVKVSGSDSLDSQSASAVNLTDLAEASAGLTSDTTLALRDTAYPFAMPKLTVSNGTPGLDVRLVDCFCLGAKIPVATTTAQTANLTAGVQTNQMVNSQSSADATLAAAPVLAPRCATSFGRLNLNTAPLATLATLPGMDDQLLARVDRARREVWDPTAATHKALATPTTLEAAWWAAGSPFGPPHWANLSDFLLDDAIWEGKELYERLDAVSLFSRLVTTHTMALRAVSENLPNASQDDPKATRRPTMIRTVRQLTGDRGALETATFSTLHPSGDLRFDSDLLSATPSKGEGSGYTARMLRAAQQANAHEAQQSLSITQKTALVQR